MTKQLPNLQVALDHSDLKGAIAAAVSVGNEVDIIEAGTVCLLQVGSELVEVLRNLFQINGLWRILNVQTLVEQSLKIMLYAEQTG